MTKTIGWTAIILVFFTGGVVFAGEKTVYLKVEKLTCASCPYIVKKSLEGVEGVSKVKVSYDKKTSSGTATVTFDDTKTNQKALTDATKNAGFPSEVVKQGG